MVLKEFVEETICRMDSPSFELIKEILLGEFISFSIMKEAKVGIDTLAEKVCDYFEKVEIKNSRSFDKLIESYLNEIDAIVAPRIGRAPQPKKGDNAPPASPRARKYYEKVLSFKNNKALTMQQLLDYMRIMMCLYTASINNEGKQIENFNYSATCLDVNRILENLRKEETFIIIPQNRHKRFELKEKYAVDACIYVISAIALCAILNESTLGGTMS